MLTLATLTNYAVMLGLPTAPVATFDLDFDPDDSWHTLIVGATATGKTFLANKFAYKAWERGYDVYRLGVQVGPDDWFCSSEGVDRDLSELTQIAATRQRAVMDNLQDTSTEPRIVVVADHLLGDDLYDERLIDLARHGRRLNMLLIVTATGVGPEFPQSLRDHLLRRVLLLGKGSCVTNLKTKGL